jgi:hypothetical protein
MTVKKPNKDVQLSFLGIENFNMEIIYGTVKTLKNIVSTNDQKPNLTIEDKTNKSANMKISFYQKDFLVVYCQNLENILERYYHILYIIFNSLWETQILIGNRMRKLIEDEVSYYNIKLSKSLNVKIDELISILTEKLFFVSFKADGLRSLLILNRYGIFLRKGYKNIVDCIKLNPIPSNDKTVIIDCEIVGQEIYGFDCLVFNSQKITSNNYLFRYSKCQSLEVYISSLINIKRYKTKEICFIKKFQSGSFFESIKKVTLIASDHGCAIDGYIFSMVDECYNSRISSIKWKPFQKLTLDLLVKEGKLCCLDNKTLIEIKTSKKYDKKYEGKIVEFYWNKQKKYLEPIDIREDKNSPNNIEVFKLLMSMVKNHSDFYSYPTLKGENFRLQRRLHQLHKSFLFGKYKSSSLLDIGTNKGSDLIKWVENGLKTVYCVEQSKTNTQIIKNRIQILKIRTKLDIHIINSKIEDYEFINQSMKQKVEMVTAFRCLTQIDTSPQSGFFKVLKAKTYCGTKVCIIFADKIKIQSLLQNRTSITILNMKIAKLSEKKYLFKLLGENPIEYEEFPITTENFKYSFKVNGFDCIEEYNLLDSLEKHYKFLISKETSSLSRIDKVLIFQKVGVK